MTIERQTIVTWYRPEEKHPPEGDIVVATVSCRRGHTTWDHVFENVVYWDGKFELEACDMDEFTVHAWCDLEPYKG